MGGEVRLTRILGYWTCSRGSLRRVVALLDSDHFFRNLECGIDTEVEDTSRHRNVDSQLRRKFQPAVGGSDYTPPVCPGDLIVRKVCRTSRKLIVLE
jgi:hypothetical protein